MVLEYLSWTNEYLRQLASSSEGRAAIIASLECDGLPRQLELLSDIEEKATDARNELRNRIRHVVGAPVSSAWEPDRRPSEERVSQMRALMDETKDSTAPGPAVQENGTPPETDWL